jgi:putative heme degradation protein
MTEKPSHELLTAGPAEVLDLLPGMGRLMVILRAGGATHERIGPVGAVSRGGGAARIAGDCHDATIPLAPIAAIAIDRSSVMKDKVYPRLEFRDAAGQVLAAVVGMEGLEPFEAALAGFPRAPEAAPEKPARAGRDDLAADDPACAPFETIAASGRPAVITASAHGASQSWQGRIEAMKPAMGFLNVMTPDFHLHLEGGSVSGWREEPGRRIALDAAGQPTGLMLASAAFA